MLANTLAFSDLTEFETTKHVHRLHSYRGKFIPQLAEFFLKKYFAPGDIILDPFCGSGTTLVQASEMGIHAVGIDVSEFAVFMANVKIGNYDRKNLIDEIIKVTEKNKNNEIDMMFQEIKKIQNPNTKKFLALILSRVMNAKSEIHPEIIYWWKKYSIDSLNRMIEFQNLKTSSYQLAISGDSRSIDLLKEVEKRDAKFANKVAAQKIKGIVSSPPYVGVIDYHEENSDSYKLFGFKRKDDLEIGPKFKGESSASRKEYSQGMIEVLTNIKKYMAPDFNIFLVVNDKFNLYPWIAKESGMIIVEKFSRPVLNRSNDKKTPYSEKIYHLTPFHSSL
jgi:DNA modification methylase